MQTLQIAWLFDGVMLDKLLLPPAQNDTDRKWEETKANLPNCGDFVHN